MNTDWRITYTDSKGEVSLRVITPISLTSREQKNYLNAYCHKRRSYRLFRADRITEIIDMKTGEISDSVEEKLSSFRPSERPETTPDPELIKFLEENLNEITALAYIAKCDGQVHEFEIDILTHFLLDRMFNRSDLNIELIIGFFMHINPKMDEYEEAIKNLKQSGKFASFVKFLVTLAEADSVVTDEESAALITTYDSMCA